MSLQKTIVLSFLLTLAVWLLFSWPLPRYLHSGIPTSSTNIEKNNVRRMTAGDHLQLHYFYWLFSDMLAGHTPLFQNIYEFNTGNDAARKKISNYNLPFSLVYAAIHPLGGNAFAWNMTGFVTLWLTHLLTLLLLLRYAGPPWIAVAAATVALAFPYRWMALLGGSPTGFAMVWVPLLALGLDKAARDGSLTGGILAAAAIAMSYVNERQIFLFSILSLPLWYGLGFIRRPSFEWRDRRFRLSVLRGLLPLAVGGGACLLLAWSAMGSFAGTNMAGGRALTEIEGFSPAPRGLLQWRATGTDAHGYVGYVLPAIGILHILLLLAAGFLRRDRRPAWRDLLAVAGIWGAMALAVLLMLGPKGPRHGAVFLHLRELVPGYEMIRQTDKIFCLFPSLLALAVGFALRELARRGPSSAVGTEPDPPGSIASTHSRTWRDDLRVVRFPAAAGAAAGLTLAALLLAEYACQVRTTVCLLDREQPAYAAVADDARSRGVFPRALILPLWPGDSAWGSLYEHYVSLYRIRMVNGYRPVVSKKYKEEVVQKLSSANLGALSDAQFEILRGMRIEYILLHENAFPEKVSPFPVYFTLSRLLAHPRLDLLKQGGDVWAFKIRTEPRLSTRQPLPNEVFFPSRFRTWECEAMHNAGATLRQAPAASGGQYLTLEAAGSQVSGEPFRHWQTPGACLKVRLRGTAQIGVSFQSNSIPVITLPRASADWTWIDVPLESVPDPVAPQLTLLSGNADLDMMLLTAGTWNPPQPGETLRLPACLFFNAGVIDAATGSLTFRTEYEADSLIFFGPRLPFDAGTYEVWLEATSPAPAGTLLGRLNVKSGAGQAGPLDVIAGRSGNPLRYEHKANLPLTLEFVYTRNADMTVNTACFRRVQ